MTTVRVMLFASAKGGVGKSTLAVATARVLAQNSARRVLLLDADFLGSSLADGLPLEAPQFGEHPDGTLRLSGPPSRVLGALESRQLRDLRVEQGLPGARHVPFLNDLLVFQPTDSDEDCRVIGASWQSPAVDGALVLPSSPAIHDLRVAQGWLHLPSGPWQARFQQLIELAVQEEPALSDVLIDLPPGLFGFYESTLGLLRRLERRAPDAGSTRVQFRGHVALIGTPDHNDITMLLEGFLRELPRTNQMTPLINRCDLSEAELQRWVRERFQDQLGPMNIERRVKRVGLHPLTLGRAFRGERFVLDEGLRQELSLALNLEIQP